MSVTRANLQSRTYTGNTTIPARANRNYFMIIFTATAGGTLEFGSGGGVLPVALDGHYEPHVAPTSSIDIVTTGTFTIIEG